MIEITLLFETPLQWRSNVPLLTGGWYLHHYPLRKMTKCCALLVLTGSETHPCLAGECTNHQGVNFGRGILYSCLKLSMDGARRRASQEKPVLVIKWLGHTLEENTLQSKTLFSFLLLYKMDGKLQGKCLVFSLMYFPSTEEHKVYKQHLNLVYHDSNNVNLHFLPATVCELNIAIFLVKITICIPFNLPN